MTETDTSAEAVERLANRLGDGIIEHPKRWSGDTHDDLGGSADYNATDALMDQAAYTLRALAAERDEWERTVGQITSGVPLPDTIKVTSTVRDLIEYFQGLAAKVEALEAERDSARNRANMIAEGAQIKVQDAVRIERERAAQVAEQWIAKDMREQMEPGAIEQNAIARQIAAAIRKGDE